MQKANFLKFALKRALCGYFLLSTRDAPLFPMIDGPIHQSLFKPYVVPGLFALQPFMPHDFLALGEKLLICAGFAENEISAGGL